VLENGRKRDKNNPMLTMVTSKKRLGLRDSKKNRGKKGRTNWTRNKKVYWSYRTRGSL